PAVAPDDGRPFNHRAVLDHCALADEHLFANPSRAFAAIAQGGTQVGLEIVLQFFERLPGIFAAVEQCSVLGLAQVEQVGRFEHDAKLRKRRRAGKAKCHEKSQIPGSKHQRSSAQGARVFTKTLVAMDPALAFYWAVAYGPDPHCLRDLERRTLHAFWRAAERRTFRQGDSARVPT